MWRVQMEQHLYTYLNQRYGLRSIIVDHASAVIRSAGQYKDRDVDVSLFLKMLRCVLSGQRCCCGGQGTADSCFSAL